MDMSPAELTQHVTDRVEKTSVQDFAESIDVSRQTVYNLLSGGWPTRDVMQKLGMRLVWKPCRKAKGE